MRYCRGVIVSAVFFMFLSGAQAAEKSENDTLPPEKTQIIYDTLLPSKKSKHEESKKGENIPRPDMTVERVSEILREKNITLQGKSGRWQFSYEGMQVFLIADSKNNRVRVMTPLARLDMLRREPDFSEVELLQDMMRANYLATGDVRLCMNKHIVWAAFLRPLDSLAERDLAGALEQLAETARKTRGRID